MHPRRLGSVAVAAIVLGMVAPPSSAVAAPPDKPAPTAITLAPAPPPPPPQTTIVITVPAEPPPETAAPPPPEPPPPAAPVATTLTIAVALTAEGLQMSGRLVDAAGAPISGASISLGFDGADFLVVGTGADGSWQALVDPAGQLTPGTHTFTSYYPGDAQHLDSVGRTTLTVAPVGPRPSVLTGAPDNPAFTSGGHLTISGRLTTDEGAPVPGGRVKAQVDDAPAEVASAITGPDGSYSFTLQLPQSAAPRPIVVHLRYDGDADHTAAALDLPGNLAPSSSPSPSASPTPTRSPSAGSSAGASGAAASKSAAVTPSSTPAVRTSTVESDGLGALGPILGVLAASVVALVVLGAVAYRWHRHN